MSFQASTWSAKQKTGSPSAKAVLMALANYAGASGECFPSNATLADDTEQSKATVQRRLSELESKGFIVRFERFKTGGGQTTMEIVLLYSDKARAYAQSRGWAPDVGPSAKETLLHAADGVAICNPAEGGDGVANCDRGGCTGETPGVALVRPLNEPSPEKSGEPPPNPQGGAVEVDAALAVWMKFETAWGFDDPTDRRLPAKKAFDRLTAEEAQAAIAAAPRYLDQCRLRSRKVCHARTWLAEHGWEAFASAAPDDQVSQTVFIAAGTPQAAAWARHYASHGRKMFMTEMNAPGGRRVGRYEPTEWPPSEPAQTGPLVALASAAVASMPEGTTR